MLYQVGVFRMEVLAGILLVLFLVHFSFGGPLSRQVTAKPEKDSSKYRLPDVVKPVSYNIKLIPNIKAETFEGKVEITIKVKESTSQIILHSKNLNINKNDIEIEEIPDDTKEPHKKTVAVKSANNVGEPGQEFFAIVLDTELKVCNKYIVKITYTGVLNNDKKGFYIAKYKDENGVEKKFATTHFQPTAARLAFPCFDEPALKAKFKITLVKPNKDYIAVSNTPRIVTSDQVEDEFAETFEMSTYQIAFIVSEMKLSNILTVNSINHQVLARPQAIKHRTEQYALETGSKILKEIENFVNVSYSLTKMDQAAIPDDYFSAGSMENWGLVTYKETNLLYSDKTTTTSRKQTIATIIAHEFGHQWFGNLVSPKWWKYLWLNEGFATYFEYRGADLVHTDWNLMDQFVVKNTQYVFGLDSLENKTRPMNHDAGSPTAISALFDRVAYEKSGSVIRMMEAFLTTQVFIKGLHYYLESRKYNYATPEHLYENLQKALDASTDIKLPSDLSVSKIMRTWTEKEGYPVSGKIPQQLNAIYENFVNAILFQSRFSLNKESVSFDSSWIIPINFATKTNKDFDNITADKWLTVKEDVIDVKYLKKDEWLLVNKKQTGYYRVNYDYKNWDLIVDALKEDHNQIHIVNRAQLIDDTFNLARSGRLSYDIPFELIWYLKNETNYIPFYSFFTAIDFLNTMLSISPYHINFKNHMLNILDCIYKHLGDEEKTDDSHTDKLNRANVLKWICDLGHDGCRTKALTKLRNWQINESTPIELNLQASTFCGAMRLANETEWQFLYSQYEEATDSIDTDLQDAFSAVCNSGSFGVNAAFQYLLNDFESLHSKLGNRMMSIISMIGSKLTTKEQLIEGIGAQGSLDNGKWPRR
ncbi:hypothetical protein ILUMI_13663 [Ignelater luminosus]|uniref:Aminopeptidase n=1 Tax=Ignelater luminosus TaxID=2038154 RepID=A0A8K0CWB4_IGNLU|nr:hypothetical protein ILUMI_13663 [Ignelater luminosus]